ncbi:ANTH-domain-containing protein [Hesseltinella vesiculosa]|uniref:ANTH-domain-containing protein n=1 Tax=Hesseltinella vesiculosa TaxID=101127 RepID=A0A1X2GKF9_9FUNG|nr:ANTH-domain-containing protein [Hesseltinella vesiculosa]
METAVRKATRLDYNPPKQKHVSTLVSLTFHNPAIIGEMLDLLERRHRENSWIISFKVLVIIHVLIRQGNGDRALSYVESHPACLDTTRLREKSSGVIHIQNIYLYTAYLQQKVAAFREVRVDHIKATDANKVGRLRRLSIKDGLLKETMVLQKLISSLLKCKFILEDVDNTISLHAFQLVVEDLLTLFQAMNEGVVNILEHYFAMAKSDARLSLEIYRRFARQTEEVTAFLDRARKFQTEMHINIPVAKHAPLSLAAALEEYLNDLESSPAKQSTANKAQNTNANSAQTQPPQQLIDFFASLENDPSLGSPVTTPQPTAHNPFRMTDPTTAAVAPSSSVMQDLASLSTPTLLTNPGMTLFQPAQQMVLSPLQQQPLALQVPTMAPSSALVVSGSTSTPVNASANNANPFRATMYASPPLVQPQPSHFLVPQPTGFMSPSSPTPTSTLSSSSFQPATSNPFGQSLTTPTLQTPQMTGFNPFAQPSSQPAPATNPWGTPSVF